MPELPRQNILGNLPRERKAGDRAIIDTRLSASRAGFLNAGLTIPPLRDAGRLTLPKGGRDSLHH